MADQQELAEIIRKFRADDCRLSDLEPLKKHVFSRILYLSYDEKEDVFQEFLIQIYKDRYLSGICYINRYIKQRVIKTMVRMGFIKDTRYKNARRLKILFFSDLEITA